MAPHVAGHADTVNDLVFTGGRVVTLDRNGTITRGLAVKDGRIVSLGTDQEVREAAGQTATEIDLAGRTLLPGINDSHLHGAWTGALWPATIMSQAGMQGDPHRKLLSSNLERRASILHAGEVLAALGITSYTEPGIGPGENEGPTGCFGSDILEEYRAIAEAGLLRQRVTTLMLFGLLDGPSEFDTFNRYLSEANWSSNDPRHFNLAGVKIFADGIPPMHSAWTHHHYPDGTSGELLVNGTGAIGRERNLRRMISTAHNAGLQVGVHATGDRSIEVVADTVGNLQSQDAKPRDLRHYVIHGDMATPSSLHRMSSLGMGVTMQPGLSVATRSMMESAFDSELVESAWPIAAALREGIPLCLSSDSPVLSPDWRLGLAAAADWVGGSLGDERQTLMMLLRCYTENPAWQDRAEDWKGTLELGKVADLCLLSTDILDLRPQELPEVEIDLTVMDGRITFQRY